MSQSNHIAKDRLTSGNKPVHERRVHLANAIYDAKAMIMTMITNWPAEYELPDGHDIYQLIEVLGVVAEDLTNVEMDKESVPGTNP